MGLFSSAVQGAKEVVQNASNNSYLVQQVHDVVSQLCQTPEFEKEECPQWFAARATEQMMLGQKESICEQARLDKKEGLTPVVAAKIIIETVRDIKLKAWEFDRFVNPIDLEVIKYRASALRTRARTLMLAGYGSNLKFDSPTLDVLEDQLMGDAQAQVPESDNVGRMRAAQGAVWAVAELRIQQLAMPIAH